MKTSLANNRRPKDKLMRPVHAAVFLAAIAVLSSGQAAAPVAAGKIIRVDPEFDALVSTGAIIEKVATGFTFTEGPLWRPQGALWFCDVPGNVVRSVTPSGEVKVIIEKAGARLQHRPARLSGLTRWLPTKTAPCSFASTVTGALYAWARI